MKKWLAATVLSVTLAGPVSANPFGATKRWVGHHKYLVVLTAVQVGSAALESYTSVNCLRDMQLAHVTTSTCSKDGWLQLELSPVFVGIDLAAYHYAPNKTARYIQPLWEGPKTAVQLDAAINNIHVSSQGYLRETWGHDDK